MSSTTLYRLSGLALLVGGALTTFGAIAQTFLLEEYSNPLWIPVATLIFVGTLFIQVGLPALYLRQMRQVGILGLIGFVLFFFGNAQVGIGFRFFDVVILPWFGRSADINPPLNFIIYSLSGILLLLTGALLFGIATIRARVFPKFPIVLFIIGLVLNRIGGHVPHVQDIGDILYNVAFVWFGYALLTRLSSAVEVPQISISTEASV